MLSVSSSKNALLRCDPEHQQPRQPVIDRWSVLGARPELSSEAFPISGSLTALVTPFDNDDIAEKSFADLVAWQIDQGAQGLVVGSATGEGPTLTSQERSLLLQIAVQIAGGRASIIAATGSNCTRESIIMTQAAQAAGAAAALIATPFYNKPSQSGLYRHYYEIARSVDLPLIIESDPARTGVDIHPDTLARLTEIPNIVGLEDTVGDPGRVGGRGFLLKRDFIWLSGDDQTSVLFRMAGGHGSVSVVANAVPKVWAEMHQASDAGDWARATAIQMQLLPLVSALRLEAGPGPIKYALCFLRPWFSPDLRLPLVPIGYETGAAIVTALTELGLIA